MKKLVCAALAVLFVLSAAPAAMAGEEGPLYTDMPADEWAVEAVTKAAALGLMHGTGNGLFGTGLPISRQEFASVLARMFGWQAVEEDAFDDIGSLAWGRGEINAAAANGAVDAGGSFRPLESITRLEMAVMLVRALGLERMASLPCSLPFTDVAPEDAGYVAAAMDVGMTNGVSETEFAPDSAATREQAAAMLVRVYERYISSVSWTHGFFALKGAEDQLEIAKRMDSVTLGWSKAVYSGGTVRLNTEKSESNEYFLPENWQEIVDGLHGAGVWLHLEVFMSGEKTIAGFLADGAATQKLADDIAAKVVELGLDGATLDLEPIRAANTDAFTAFTAKVDAALEANGKTLYVCTMPATYKWGYYDGYDFRALGELADKVIVMAHDYGPTSIPTGTRTHEGCPQTPIDEVYYTLRVALDPETGVRDPEHLAIAVCLSAKAWWVNSSGLLIREKPTSPVSSTVHKRLIQAGAVMGWNENLKSCYLKYRTEDGSNIFLWYEDERSIGAKLDLAALFGVTSVSVWRIGMIPDYPEEGKYFDLTELLTSK